MRTGRGPLRGSAGRALAATAIVAGGLAAAAPADAGGPGPQAATVTRAASGASVASSPACQARLVEGAAGLARAVGPTRFVCDGGWALAQRGTGTAVTLELFKATASGWAEQPTGNGRELDYAPEALGIPLAVLVRLGTGVGPSAGPDVGAAVLVRAASAKASGGPVPWAASAVVGAGGGDWLATGYAVDAPPGPGAVLSIYRWHGAWARQARLAGLPGGQLAGGGSITTASLTASSGPDFVVRSYGADTNWLSVVSDAGGTWHAVPFDYGYGTSIAVDAAGVDGHLVETETNGCGCAVGPETYTWEIYTKGAFRPTAPPGPVLACSPAALESAADPASLLGLVITRASCAYGWALGPGTGPGYTNGFVGLFEQQGDEWQTINIDDGTALGAILRFTTYPSRCSTGSAPGSGPVSLRRWPSEPCTGGWTWPGTRRCGQ